MKSLKKLMIIGGLLAFIVLLQSCIKDIGNYDYESINEISIGGIDSVYIITRNDTLKINPTVTYSKDLKGDTSNYEYSWLEIRMIGFNSSYPTLISNDINLNKKITSGERSYEYSFRVKDKRTGVWKEQYFVLTVTNDIYEGWFVLSEVPNENSRLDMLSYKHQTNDYVFLKDVLAIKNPNFILEGLPNFLNVTTYNYISFGTNKLANILHTNNLTSKPIPDFPQAFVTNKNEAIGDDVRYYGDVSQSLLWNNGKVFANQSGGNSSSTFVEITKYSNNVGFRASPFISYLDGFDDILFNEDKKELVWYAGNGASSCIRIDNEEIQEKVRGKELLYMKKTPYNQDNTFAVLKDILTNKVFLMLFTRSKLIYFQEILNTDIVNAKHFEVSDEFGYLYYCIGNKLYAYDFNTFVNKEMADYGQKKISMLKFNKISFVGISKTPRYEEINRSLCVGTYLEGDLENSGTLDIYQVTPALGQLVKKESYTGFGKLKDITYRAR